MFINNIANALGMNWRTVKKCVTGDLKKSGGVYKDSREKSF